MNAIVRRDERRYAGAAYGPRGARQPAHRWPPKVTRMFQPHARNRSVAGSGIAHVAARFFAPELAAWRGRQPLWKVFWLYGVAVSGILIAIYLFAFLIEAVALRQILVLCFAPYTAWIVVSIWRCAFNAREKFWGMLARFLTVAWAGNTIFIVVFIEMNLMTHYYLKY